MQTRAITQDATTPPRSTREAPKPGNAPESTLGGLNGKSENRESGRNTANSTWTDLRIEGKRLRLNRSQARVAKIINQLFGAEELVVKSTELTRMAELPEPQLSQVFRAGHPAIGVLFRYLPSPRGFIEILLEDHIHASEMHLKIISKSSVDPLESGRRF